MGISAVLLAHRKAGNLKVLLPQIKENLEKCGEDYEILVVGTMGPLDNTSDVCHDFGAGYVNQEEPHFGGAFRTGIKYARMDKFLMLYSDGAHNPKYIPDLYDKFTGGADVVIGSRYITGGKTNDALVSKVVSFMLNTAFRLFLGINVRDIFTGFRIYSTGELKNLELSCDNYDVLQEVLLKLKLNNPELIIAETPINFDKRISGESKRRPITFIISYIKTLFRLTCLRIYCMRQNVETKKTLNQFVFYVIIGLVAAVIDFSIFYSINRYTNSAHLVLSNIASSFVAFLFCFLCNTFVNFKKSSRLLRRFLSYLIISASGMCLTSVIIYLLKNFINLSLLKIFCIGFVSVLQFIFNKKITYRH